ncbi:TonB-dependent receptor plug domain-containing protein [Hymenobacter weizhouensis]|uniref:TonB-dependent receptor plug domain-containing protein n=1 Tax=Hymenobacter sp. YIM 151500-1 TaxID=2987689 RepID=UPI0022263B9D|nr:TonB-dependent receptor [Hymenobacter sp. YIM 151500-1]UYZ62851.1 TonB-dependent receptor [Hymenobacter sp. YIM 151500-1]
MAARTGLGQAPSTADSAAVSPQQLPTVRVQATRIERFSVGSRRLTLDSLALAPYRTGTLTDVLGARTAIHLRNYGPGQLSSITLRGTSARHTAVLWQGFNINLPSLGEADFALLPTLGNTQVDIQPGPAGATYGNGAVGGTVLLSSAVRWGAGWHGAAQVEGGSFGLHAGTMEAGFSNQKLALRTTLLYRQADNDFPYFAQEAAGLVRHRQQNAAFRQASFTQDLTLRLGQRGELTAAAWLTDADRQIQPGIGTNNTHGREWDQSRRFTAGYRHLSPRHEWTGRVAWFEDVLNYRDDVSGLSESRVRTTQAQAEHTWNLRPNASVRLGAETQHFAAQVDGYGADPRIEDRFSGFLLLRYDPRPRLRLSANLRQAVLPGRQPPLTPTAGLEWEALRRGPHLLTLKGSASRSYRAPTLNERYWRPGGNPDLLPEHSLGYEAGLGHILDWPAPSLRLQTELTAYRQLVDNWVQWTPGATYWSPRNLRQVRAQGLEASSQLTWRPGAYQLTARATYAFTQSEKTRGTAADSDPVGRQLPFVPRHTAALSTDHAWRGWQLGSTLTFTGYRYTDASATSFLPSFLLLNASVGRILAVHPAWRLVVLAQGYNLTNQTYQSYQNRAMPLRHGALSLRVLWR